jgi:hypothetical protein
MIGWTHLLFTALWTLGLAALLATLSLAHWLASQSQETLRRTLMEPRFRLAIAAEFLLIALGSLLSVEPWWHKIAWAGVLALAAWEVIVARRDWRSGQTKRS